MPNTQSYDAIIIGAGAAGLFCAGELGQSGKRVLILDHSNKPAEKVRISGGGRCNFTNIHTAPDRFITANPHFAKSALARYTPQDFLDLLASHEISWHEKTLGQLFCDQRAGAIIEMLLSELAKGGGSLRLETEVTQITEQSGTYELATSTGPLKTPNLIIATGGLSIPKMGASSFAYDIARQFGHNISETRAGLVPFMFSGPDKDDFASISGVACPVRAEAGGTSFEEAMLFTHRGLSGPAMLQISSYWQAGEEIRIDLLAGAGALQKLKADHPRQTLATALETLLPKRLVALLVKRDMIPNDTRLSEMSDAKLGEITNQFSNWPLKPVSTEGYRTAEVTVGGIDTDELSSKTMESRRASGLYFIGECVDVTGWLGGYNFQWAWASAHAAAEAIA